MAKNSDNDMVPPIVSSNTPTSKTSRKPKSIVWGDHIKQEKQISKGHWNTTCNYCNQFWYKGSSAALEDYLSNLYNNMPLDVRDLFLNWLAAKALEVDISKSKKRKLGNQSNQAQLSDFIKRNTLKILAEENLVEGGGLKWWVDTRWHTIYDYIFLIIRYKVPLEIIHNSDNLAISILELQNCSLADCFVGLVHLGAAIRRLPENDYHKRLANEERPVNEERLSNEQKLSNKERPSNEKRANEGRLGNKERPANKEPTNEEMEDTFIPLKEKILKNREIDNNIKNDEEDWDPERK
ncbi:1131_t:CDS:2, partial [Dentiscutata heterogama]